MQLNRNVLKKEILEYLATHGLAIGWDIIKGVGKESHNVRNALGRLRRNGLVRVPEEKIRAGPRNRMVYQYSITEKGVKRLSFYQEKEKAKPKKVKE